MTHNHFYDGDAAPLTGKSPVQVRVRGGTMSEATLAGVRGVLSSFLGGARISLAQNLQKTVTLPGGVEVRMSSRYGVVSADVDIPPTEVLEDDTPEFYGGIVIRPYCLNNEEAFVAAPPGVVAADDFVLPEVETKGYPRAPSLTPNDTTTHLIVQVKRGVSLSTAPVAKGYIRIFRITDPLVGLHAEVHESAERYLVSGKEDFSEFYLCGVKLTRVPALPETTYTVARVCTHGFVPTSFEQAAPATGLLFVAVNKKLYGVDAGAEEPTWALLAEALFDDELAYANNFGDTISRSTSPTGVVTVTCTGSNGAGVCSNFSVTITPGSPRPSLSGAITLMHDGTVPGVSQPRAYTATLTIEGTNTVGSSQGAPAYIAEHNVVRVDADITGAGVMPLLSDRFLGGTFPRYDTAERSVVETWTCSGTFDGWVVPDIMTGYEFPESSWTFSYERVATTTAGTQVTTTTYNWDRVLRYVGSSSSVRSFGQEYPAAIALSIDPVKRFYYTVTDEHVGKLAWRRDAQRSATRTQYPTQTGPSGGETLAEGYPGQPETPPPGGYAPVGEQTTSFSALEHAYELLRSNGEVLVRWTSLSELFGATPYWAQAYDLVEDRADEDKYGNLPGYTTSIASGPFTVVGGSPPQVNTSPFWNINWSGPVGVARDSFPDVGQHYPCPFPGGTNFSHENVFNSESPVTFGVVDYAAYFTPSKYDDPIFPAPDPSGIVTVSPQYPPQTPVGESGLYCDPGLTGNAGAYIGHSGAALYDPRSGGFIAWAHIVVEMTPGTWALHHEAFVGNDVDMISLRDVIDEWRALGPSNPVSESKRMLFESPAEVSLL